RAKRVRRQGRGQRELGGAAGESRSHSGGLVTEARIPQPSLQRRVAISSACARYLHVISTLFARFGDYGKAPLVPTHRRQIQKLTVNHPESQTGQQSNRAVGRMRIVEKSVAEHGIGERRMFGTANGECNPATEW